MQFKNPGGDLTWLTPLWLLAGGFLAYVNFSEGAVVFGLLYASLALFSLLVWFDLKWVAIPLMIYIGIATLGGILMLFIQGFSWLLLSKLALAGYSLYGLWVWGIRREEQ